MIKYCPNCKGELIQSGGVKKCNYCDGKYYILETDNPKLNKHDVSNALINLLKDIKFSYELTGGIMPQEMERLNKAINDC